jgi:hypothetical protein
VGATAEVGVAADDDGAAAGAVVVPLGLVSTARVELATVRESLAHDVATRMAATRTEEQLM